MPVLGVPLDGFTKLLGRELPAETLENELHRFGCSVEGWTSVRRWRCARCAGLSESAEPEAPVACESCGVPLRDAGPEDLGEVHVLRMELLAVRPDLFDEAGLARAMRGFLGDEEGAPAYAAIDGAYSVEVREVRVRPRIAAAIVRGVEIDDARLRSLMKLQENIHWALGRDRKLASIGVYDLARVRGERLVYREASPDAPRFVPLGLDPDDRENSWSPADILERHPKGVAFARLLQGAPAFPLLEDAEGGVLSMPPIINSEATRVTTATRDLLVDVTGLEDRHVDRALHIVVTSLAETSPGASIESCTLRYADGTTRVTPDLRGRETSLDVDATARLLGLELTSEELAGLLRRMRHDARAEGDSVIVEVPAWRADIMHARDLMEDAAIAYGYDRMPEVRTTGVTHARAHPASDADARARRVLAGLGGLEVMTLALSSEELTYTRCGLPDRGEHVRLENPISVEQTMLRVSLVPGLMETLAINLGNPYPQRLFEVGRVSLLDPGAQNGAREARRAGLALAGDGLGFADIRAAVDVVLHELSGAPSEEFRWSALGEELFLPGRGAQVEAGTHFVARAGEVSPEVLERFRIIHPVALFELDLDALEALRGSASRSPS